MNKKIKILSILLVSIIIFYNIFITQPIALAHDNKEDNNIRIASLSTNITEIIIMLNQKNKLVGVTTACNYITEANNIAIIGDLGIPNIEKLLTTKTNIVITSIHKDPLITKTINELGIKYYYLPINSIDEYYKTLFTIGKILNAEQNANNIIKNIKNTLNELQKNIKFKCKKNIQKPTVFIMISSNPLITAGNKSFLNEMINQAGGINIASNLNKDYPIVSKEWLISQNPDFIIAPQLPESIIRYFKNDKMWSNISAIKNNKIYNDINPNVLYVMGSNVIKLIMTIHDILYKNK